LVAAELEQVAIAGNEKVGLSGDDVVVVTVGGDYRRGRGGVTSSTASM